jgi:hypothetical protein
VKTKRGYILKRVVALVLPFWTGTGLGASTGSVASTPAQAQAAAPALRINVDPRVELLSLIFRLAGNPEYSQGKVASYTVDAEKQFAKFRDHPVVTLARDLRNRQGVSYDACMSMAVHVADAYELQPLLPLKPWPDGLDRRWTASDVDRFLDAARQFVKDTSVREFFDRHRSLYETTESRMKSLMEKEAHLEWFNEYFGERPQATFTLAPALLNGGCCYGPHFRDAGGKENLYCVLGVWKTDGAGLPVFTHDMLETIIHEFGHSYANPIMDRHQSQLQSAADQLFRQVSGKMRSQAYGDSQTMMRESLVRACEVRYTFRYDGANAGQKSIAHHKGRGFLWMEELSNLLADYEGHRERYATLDSFSPRLVSFFKDYAGGFAEKQAALETQRPKVVSMTPANGAEGVDPGLGSIRVVFDRPMRDRSWSLVGGGPHCPETTGKASYDSARTIWTVPVKLKPEWDYEFMLNSESYDAFRSAEGVPLEPVQVTFKTGKPK